VSPRPLGYATVAVLQALADGHRYGFDVIDRTGLPSGTVYPALATLTARGLVKSRWEDGTVAHEEGRPRRRYYALTEVGAVALDEARRRLQSLGLAGPSRAADPEPA